MRIGKRGGRQQKKGFFLERDNQIACLLLWLCLNHIITFFFRGTNKIANYTEQRQKSVIMAFTAYGVSYCFQLIPPSVNFKILMV
jgi:hypothetical protein